MHLLMVATRDDRCACHGQCGRFTGKPKACAEPDLLGRCRGYNNVAHPRSYQIIHLTGYRVGRNQWVGLCQNCLALLQSGLKDVIADEPDLFTEEPPT
jgi:hypothetical protein